MRQAALCGLLIFALSAPVRAFKVGTHRAVTTEALAASKFAFSELAVLEILNANECTDTGPVLGAPDDKPCVPDLFSVDQQMGEPEHHFDDEKFLVGGARLRALKIQTLMMAREGRFIEARKLLGSALHTIQDFYAHSNWLELGNTATIPDIEDFQRLYVLHEETRPGVLRIATASEDVCQFREVPMRETSGRVVVTKNTDSTILLPKASKGGNVLTSGYFFANVPNSIAKCTHGFIFDGLNKDTESTNHGKQYFTLARRLAREHSVLWVNDVLGQLDKKAARGVTVAVSYVSANQVNPTRIEVRKGEVYVFKTPTKQQIVWGYEGYLDAIFGTGRAYTAGPDGVDASSLARVGLYPPPIRNRGVGALIGRVEPPVYCYTVPPDAEGVGGTHCPPAFFFIGSGTINVTIPIDGTLHLQVNDDVLGNNSGVFETEFTLLKKTPAR